MRVLGVWIGMLLSVLYLLNPTAGIFELLPDALPVIGNLDEAAAMALFLTCLRSLRSGRALAVRAQDRV